MKRVAGGLLLDLQRAISQLGERTGSQWLVYNPLVHYGFERAARRNAPIFVQSIRSLLPDVNRTIDVGCGTGRYVEELERHGYDAMGVEFDARLRGKCRRRGVRAMPFDVSQSIPPPPGAPFDLAYSLEVAEHLPAVLAPALIDYISALSRVVVFTAAQPGQGGTGHINEQPREYWIDLFESRSLLRLSPDLTSRFAASLRHGGAFEYLAANASVFVA